LRFRWIQRPAEAVLLHVAVARAAGAGSVQCDLDQAGTIDSEAALAAPQIGRADEPLGHFDKIVLKVIEIAEMLPRQIPALARDSESAVLARHRQKRIHHQRGQWRQFDRSARKRKGPDRGNLVRRRGAGFGERRIRQPADIAIAVELPPGPALAIAIVDRRPLSLERLGPEPGVGRWFFPQRCDRV